MNEHSLGSKGRSQDCQRLGGSAALGTLRSVPHEDELPLPDFEVPAESSPAAAGPADAYLKAQKAIEATHQTEPGVAPSGGGLPERSSHLPSAPDRNGVLWVDAPHPGFDARYWDAFKVPFLGVGSLFMLLIALSVVVGLFFFGTRVSLFIAPAACAIGVALQSVFFGQAAQLGMMDEGGELEVSWTFPSRDELAMQGAVMVFAMVAVSMPAIFLTHHGQAWAVVLWALPLAYWPMALLSVGISGTAWTLFRPFLMVRFAWATRRSFWRVMAPAVVCVVIGAGLHVMSPFIALLFAAGAFAYLGGVQGFMMGSLAGTDPKVFVVLREDTP